MSEGRIVQIKPASGTGRNPGPVGTSRSCKAGANGLVALALVAVASFCPPAGAQEGVTETWADQNVELEPRESVQISVTYDQIPVRSWTLVVDGGDRNCDLNVRRGRDGSLVYQKRDQRRHEVPVPWGEGEELSVVLTNRDRRAAFVVALEGPPRDQVHASYSFHVNRALEDFAAGRRLDAEDQCRLALRRDPDDGVAKVLLAGFLRDQHYYDQAAAMVDEALAGPPLPGTMKEVALGLQRDLLRLRAPLPLPVRKGVEEAESLLDAGDGEGALRVVDDLIAARFELEPPARGRLQLLRGRALGLAGRNFEALDAFTLALQLDSDKGFRAVVSFHMGNLFLGMGNLPQAEGAFTMALQDGLPSGLAVQARERLQAITRRLDEDR